MCFHTSEFGECLEEVDLKMAVAICDLNQKMNQIVLNGNKKVTWAKNSKVIAVHNGSKCYLFLFNKDEFQKWAEAFKKVEISQYRDLDLWVDADLQGPPVVQVIQELSYKKQNLNFTEL